MKIEKLKEYFKKAGLRVKEETEKAIFEDLVEAIGKEVIAVRPETIIENRHKRVYKYIPLSKVDIYVTPHSRNDNIKEKLEDAKPIAEYVYDLKKGEFNEKRIEYIFKNFSIEKNEEILIEQEKYYIKEPYKITYNNDVFYEIYYMEESSRYAILIAEEDIVFPEIQYVLTRKIRMKYSKKEEYIYAGIINLEQSSNFLKKEELLELEDILWYFTKEWPVSYELYNKKNVSTLEIVGKLEVYNGLKSIYRISIKTKEEAQRLLKLYRAINILQKKTEKYIKFEPKVSYKGFVEFTYNDMKFEYEDIAEFMALNYSKLYSKLLLSLNEYMNKSTQLNQITEEKEKNEEKLTLMQNQISLYLNARKSLLGKFRYYLRKDPLKEIEEENIKNEKGNKNPEKTEEEKEVIQVKEKYGSDKYNEYCTIEEFVELYNEYKKYKEKLRDLNSDIVVIKQLNKNVEQNIENALKYLKEISDEKKSILGFLRYSSKEKAEMLMGTPKEETEKNIRKVFNYEMDFFGFAEKVDKYQRSILEEEEIISVHLAANGMLKNINQLKLKEINEQTLDMYMKDLAAEYEEKYGQEEYDIFGNASNESRTRYLGDKSFRESDREIYAEIKYKKDIEKAELLSIIEKNKELLDKSIEKTKHDIKMSFYKIGNWSSKLKEEVYDIYNLNVEEEEKNIKEEDVTYNLFHVEMETDFKAIFLSNIFFYKNENKTLPNGMDVTTQAIIDMSKYNFVLSEMKKNKIMYIKDDYAQSKTLNIFKYKAYLKK